MESVISVRSLTKKFGDHVAVCDIDFEVHPGEIFGFLGPNGAGKTTTIKMIVGMLAPTEGSASVCGIDVAADPVGAKRHLSYVPDNPDLYDWMTGEEYLSFIADIYEVPLEDRRSRIERYAELFEMQDFLGARIGECSHGMQQKICLIGALLPDPELLLLDEPMVGLDPKSAFRLKELMRDRCAAGKCVMFSTHVMEVAEKLCDRIAILNKGKLVVVGTLDEIRAKAKDEGDLETLFLELTE